MSGFTHKAVALAVVAAVTLSTALAKAAEAKNDAGGRTYQRTVSKGINFLLARQDEDGSFSKQMGPAVTSLVTASLLRHGRTVKDPAVVKALKYMERFVQASGGIHHPKSLFRNYETCLAVLCFKEANKDGRYEKILQGADRFLKGLQWAEGEGKDESDFYYGGAGYGKHKRPDLSNTQFFIEALLATGNGPDDENLKKALIFVSRCQNLESEHNTTPFSSKINDEGFYYTPADGGRSQAHPGLLPNGGLRSYASMTYAGLKSMIYCGLKPDDPRVKGATEWISKHYDLTSNPGLGSSGLYYYYHTFAKTLDALGHDTFIDAKGKRHHWRQELTDELARRQQKDGSWVNENDHWMEGEANLVTAYALMALSYCRPKK